MKYEKPYFSQHITMSLKGIAILLMLFHHLFSHATTYEDVYQVLFTPFTRDQVNLFSEGGAICVSMFVFLTGYGMTISLKRKKTGREKETYCVRRYLTLQVSFFIVFIVSIATSMFRSDHLSMYFTDGRASAIRYILTDALGFSTFAGTPGYCETWWYISYAVLLILVMPVIAELVHRFGIVMVPLAGMVKSFGLDDSRPFTRYLLVLVLGCYLADREVFGALRAYFNTTSRRVPALFILPVLSIGSFCLHLKWGLLPWANAFTIFTLTCFLFILTDLCSVRLRLLEFTGRYSMNIFLIHSILYGKYFTDLVYAPRHFVLIELTLLLLSLAVSIPLDFLQKLALKKLRLK